MTPLRSAWQLPGEPWLSSTHGKVGEFAHIQPSNSIAEPGKYRHRTEFSKNSKIQLWHDLEWNYKEGKKPGHDEGLLKGKACGRSWKWKDRLKQQFAAHYLQQKSSHCH